MSVALRLYVADAAGGPIRQGDPASPGRRGNDSAVELLNLKDKQPLVRLVVMARNRGESAPSVARFNLGIESGEVQVADPGEFQGKPRLADILGSVIRIVADDRPVTEGALETPVRPSVDWLELVWESQRGTTVPLWADNAELIPITEVTLRLMNLPVVHPARTWIAWRCLAEGMQQTRGIAVLYHTERNAHLVNMDAYRWTGEREG